MKVHSNGLSNRFKCLDPSNVERIIINKTFGGIYLVICTQRNPQDYNGSKARSKLPPK